MKMPNIQALYAFVSHLSKRERSIFYAVVLVVSLVLLDRLIINPIYSKIGSLDKEIREKESDVKKNIRIVSQKDQIIAESAKYSSFLNAAVSEEEEVTSILKEVETIANKNSVYMSNMKPGSSKKIGLSKKYTVNLDCEAQMEQLTEFMYNIENSNKLLTIEKYEISPKAKESSIAKCSMTISKIAVL
jgi:Tfp pilus assembly protein PilO